MEILQSNSPALNNFFCSSGKCFGGRQCGFVSLACFQLCLWGHKALTFLSHHSSLSFCSFLSFSPILLSPSSVGYLFLPQNKWRNAAVYFHNLGWGEGSCRTSVWLTGEHAGNAQRFSVCLGLWLLAAQTWPEKQERRATAQDLVFFFTGMSISSTFHVFVCTSALRLSSLPLFDLFIFLVQYLSPSLSYSHFGLESGFLGLSQSYGVGFELESWVDGDTMSHTQFPSSIPGLIGIVYLCSHSPGLTAQYW